MSKKLKYSDLDAYYDLLLTRELNKTDGVKRLTVTVIIYEKTTVTWFSVWGKSEEEYEDYHVLNVYETLEEAIEAYNKI